MLEAFIVTLWIEYNGKLYMKEADSITRNCESTTKNLYKRFEELPTMRLIAVKCDTVQSFTDRKDYFNDKR